MKVFNLTFLECRLLFREKMSAFMIFVFPVVMLAIIASITDGFFYGGLKSIQIYTPSWISINILTISLFTIGVTLTSYREQGILRRYRATPLGAYKILMSHFLYGSFIFFLSFIIISIEGIVFLGLNFPKFPLSLCIALIISVIAMFSFGLFVNSLAKTTRQGATFSSIILNFMLLFSGATIPMYLLPQWLQYLAKIIPLYYAIEIIKGTWNTAPITNYIFEIVMLLINCIIFSFLSIKYFKWDSN